MFESIGWDGLAGLGGLFLAVFGALVAVFGATINAFRTPSDGGGGGDEGGPVTAAVGGFWTKVGDAVKTVASTFAKTVSALVRMQFKVLGRIMRPEQPGDQLLFLGIWMMILSVLAFAIALAIWVLGLVFDNPSQLPGPDDTPTPTPST